MKTNGETNEEYVRETSEEYVTNEQSSKKLVFKSTEYQDIADWSKSVLDALSSRIEYNERNEYGFVKTTKLYENLRKDNRVCILVSPITGLIKNEDTKEIRDEETRDQISKVGKILEFAELEMMDAVWDGNNFPESLKQHQEPLIITGVNVYIEEAREQGVVSRANVVKTSEDYDGFIKIKCTVFYMPKSIYPLNQRVKELTKNKLSLYGYVLMLEEKWG